MRTICALLVSTIALGCLNESNDSYFFDRYTHWQFRAALPTQDALADAVNIDGAPPGAGCGLGGARGVEHDFLPLGQRSGRRPGQEAGLGF